MLLIAIIILICQYTSVLVHYAMEGRFESRIAVLLRLIPFSCVVYFIIWIVKGWKDLP